MDEVVIRTLLEFFGEVVVLELEMMSVLSLPSSMIVMGWWTDKTSESWRNLP